MATYSTNPNDWYFDVHTDEDGEMTMIGLSQEPGTLDDQLGGHNLPKEIGDLLSSVGVDTETELMESVFEFTGDEDCEITSEEELINRIKTLGFNKSELFDH